MLFLEVISEEANGTLVNTSQSEVIKAWYIDIKGSDENFYHVYRRIYDIQIIIAAVFFKLIPCLMIFIMIALIIRKLQQVHVEYIYF